MNNPEALRIKRSLEAATDRREISFKSLQLMKRVHEIEIEELMQIWESPTMAEAAQARIRSSIDAEIVIQHAALAALDGLITSMGQGLE